MGRYPISSTIRSCGWLSNFSRSSSRPSPRVLPKVAMSAVPVTNGVRTPCSQALSPAPIDLAPSTRSDIRSMIRANQKKLADRVVRAAEAALEAQHYVRPIDVLAGIGWLAPGEEKRWRQGQTDYLERAVQANLRKISEAMKLLRQWANAEGLLPRESQYLTNARPADAAFQYQRRAIHRTGG
jgi:ribosomal protein S7